MKLGVHTLVYAILAFAPLASALEVNPAFNDSPAAQATVALAILICVGFGVGVVIYYKRTRADETMDNTTFVTAKNSASKWAIAWSFYASGIGSWVLTGPADLAFFAGLISVFAYGFAVGLPVLVIAFFGPKIQSAYPDILSLSDFINFRFGRGTQALVVLLTVFNMGVAAAAEYTTIAAFFAGYVGLNDYDIFVVLTVALVTLSYTAYGGLPVSIITDRVQALASVLLVTILTISILATLKPFPSAESLAFCISGENTTAGEPCSITFLDQLYGTYEAGYGTLFTLPLSLVCATVFSEAFWQRAWAAQDESALKFGAVVAAIALFSITFIFGLIGVYGGWTGLTGFASDPNLRVFQALEGEAGQTIVTTGWGVLLILLGVIMSQAALDSLQNGIGASVNGVITKQIEKMDSFPVTPLTVSRIATVLVNVPLIIVGVQKYEILRLFLVSNMVTTSATFPVVLGFIKHPFFSKYHLDIVPPLAFIVSMLALMGYGTSKVGGDFSAGVQLALWDQLYEWDYFLVAFCTSVGVTVILDGVIYLIDTYYTKITPPDLEIKLSEIKTAEVVP